MKNIFVIFSIVSFVVGIAMLTNLAPAFIAFEASGVDAPEEMLLEAFKGLLLLLPISSFSLLFGSHENGSWFIRLFSLVKLLTSIGLVLLVWSLVSEEASLWTATKGALGASVLVFIDLDSVRTFFKRTA